MATLTQKNMDFAQTQLRRLINLADDAHGELCTMGLTEQRDTVREGQAYLMLAEAKLGQLVIPTDDGEVSTRSGDK